MPADLHIEEEKDQRVDPKNPRRPEYCKNYDRKNSESRSTSHLCLRIKIKFAFVFTYTCFYEPAALVITIRERETTQLVVCFTKLEIYKTKSK